MSASRQHRTFRPAPVAHVEGAGENVGLTGRSNRKEGGLVIAVGNGRWETLTEFCGEIQKDRDHL
jgi:hypothetical protein